MAGSLLCLLYVSSTSRRYQGIWIINESRVYVQSVIETESTYEGITQDERIALRQFIDIKVEELVVQEQFPDLLLLQGSMK